jgi:hypothetical protein
MTVIFISEGFNFNKLNCITLSDRLKFGNKKFLAAQLNIIFTYQSNL